jgi:dephospho-CoA kinase
MNMVLYIGLAGTILAGKGAVRELLTEKYNAYTFSLSDMLREEADRRGIEKTRQALTDIADELRLKKGNGVLAEMSLEKISKMKEHHNIVIMDSIRNPGEVEALRTALKRHFFLIFIDAPIDIRYQRSLERKREGEGGKTFIEFEAKDREEIRGRSDRLIVDERGHHGEMIDYGVNLGACKRSANKVLINDGTLQELEKKAVDAVEHKMKSLKEKVD